MTVAIDPASAVPGKRRKPLRSKPKTAPTADPRPHQWGMLQAELGISEKDWEQLGPQTRRIITELLPAFVQQFVRKAMHYGPNNANVLGPAGQFADIWRKIGPLKRALWEGAELTGEGPDEICRDLIGHSLLTIDMLQQGVNARGGPVS